MVRRGAGAVTAARGTACFGTACLAAGIAGALARGGEARWAAFEGPMAAGWFSGETMLSIEPVVAGPISRVLPQLSVRGSLTDGIVFRSLMALTLGYCRPD
jgi:hypothetical protein